MSLYSMEEICAGCIHAEFLERPTGEHVFFDCKDDREKEVDAISCACQYKINKSDGDE